MEEGVELTDQMLSPESFPWHESPLIIAALKTGSEAEWLINEGPELKGLVRSDGANTWQCS
jgi:hypothetical protein